MRIFRRLFCVLAVIFFFLLGISAADKEYLSGSIVGICILTEEYDSSAQLRDFIEQSNCTDVLELCQQIMDGGFGTSVGCCKRYFNAHTSRDGYIPAGVYDTIVIDLSGNGGPETVYLKQLKPLGHRFGQSNVPVISSVQKYYISFLSIVGKAEKLVLEFIG